MKRKKNYKPAIFLATCVIAATSGMVYMTGLPKPGASGGTKATEDDALFLERDANLLKEDVLYQCDEVGRRTSRFSPQQKKFNEWMEYTLEGNRFEVTVQDYPAGSSRGRNVIGVRKGELPGAIVVGTHYDSYGKGPCANSSASGVATVTALARRFATLRPKKTLIVAFFGTGERPHRGKETAGAAVWLKKAKEDGVQIDLAILVGSYGIYMDVPGSQLSTVPWKFVAPETADWVGIYGDLVGRGTVVEMLNHWGQVTDLPARGFATPAWLPGIPAEDQVPFQEAGIPAVLFSDSGTERTPSLRTQYDSPYEIDFIEMARRVKALGDVVERCVMSN
ncbi:MAG: M28 family peptidase [Planctomycetota bacterium]